jgi:hypothetical protein
MKKRAGITRIDLVVALACMVFILANVPVIMAGGRGRAKREVCMANLRTLTAAWTMYANDHQGRIPCADIYYCHDPVAGAGDPTNPYTGPGWYEWQHIWNTNTPPFDGSKEPPHDYDYWLSSPTETDWQHAIACGTLWQYIRDYRIYRCHVGNKREFVTYAISHSMNAYVDAAGIPFGAGSHDQAIRIISQIPKPAERMVFGDQGYASNGAYAVYYSRPKFHDVPPKNHGGQALSYADGHCGFHKWVDQRTIDYYWDDPTDQMNPTCNQDLLWLQKVIWGKIGYTLPSNCTPEF